VLGPSNYVSQSTECITRVAEENRRSKEDAERIAESMDRAAEYAQSIGQTFGEAMADVLMGATSIKQVIAGLVSQGARQGLGAAFGAVFAGLRGATGAQSAGDTGGVRPGSGVSIRGGGE
jgi:hypothetical protein